MADTSEYTVDSVGLVLAIPQYGRRCNIGCPRHYQPVCASNGRSYANSCTLRVATCRNPRIRFVHRGRCRKPGPANCENRACTLEYDPVCGTNGQTYTDEIAEPRPGNPCLLRLAKCQRPNLRRKHRGRCGGKNLV